MDVRLWVGPNNGATYDDLVSSAREAEQMGFAGFFLSDHFAPFVGDGRPGPTDVWTTLAGVARETTRIRLGPLVASNTFRHPALLAVVVAQIDHMSGGRLDFGIGAGYFEREHDALGIPFPPARERSERLGEALELVTGSWQTPAGQLYSFSGEHYQIVDSPGLPKPLQDPHPPIILGGTGKKRTPALAGRFADEFNLQTTRRHTPQDAEHWLDTQELADQIERVRTAAAGHGRDPRDVTFSMSAAIGVGTTAERAAAALDPRHFDSQTFDGASFSGSPEQIVDELATYATLGISRVYVRTPIHLRDLRDGFELLATDVLPRLADLP